MRWEVLKADHDEERELPGIAGSTGVVRRFDAPEALGVSFHEVRAKSALNKVPEKSRMPFRYTVNPYRGCSHACTYCMGGDTPVLLASGRTRRIAELRVGDKVYGTVKEGAYRRYVVTDVLAHWTSIKEGHRITLEDGTELIASADHRFLTKRGWKHVVGSEWGPMQRPHLTLNSELMGTGKFAGQPQHTRDYRRGYLCGLIRGDGHVGSYSYERPGRSHGDVHRFRLALTDFEPLQRAREYLQDLKIETHEFLFLAAAGAHNEMRAIRSSSRDKVAAVRDAIRWPDIATDGWRKGFLAGIFDAEGCHSQGVLRISNCDPEIIDWTADCLRRLGFTVAFDRTSNANGLTHVRFLGGLAERLRFFHTVDPAITRKRSIEGTAIKTKARLRVVDIEPLGKRHELFDITTGTGDFIADGVVSHNCFARPTHTYLDLNAAEDFEREIVVKVNVPELLRAELARPSWNHELVAFGTNTDPYQWVEGRYELMPPMLAALAEQANPTTVLTKSSLALRDIERFKALAEVTDASVNFSVPTLEEKAWRETEPHTPHPRKRLEAVAELNAAGIPSGVLIAPLMPGINDDPAQVAEIADIAEDAGASFISGISLHLRPGVKEVFMDWLRVSRPDLVKRYERLYDGRAYLRTDDKAEVEAGLDGRRRGRGRGLKPAKKRRPKAEPRQPSLF